MKSQTSREKNYRTMIKSIFKNQLQIVILVVVICISNYRTYAQLTKNKELVEYSINKNGREMFGIKNSKGEIVLNANYSFIRWAEDYNYALIGHPTTIEGTGIIDRQGKVILDPLEYKNCDIPLYKNDEGLLVVFIGGFAKTSVCLDKAPYTLFGFINTRGEEVVRPQYIKVGEYINGTVEVETVDGKIFRIDSTGTKVK